MKILKKNSCLELVVFIFFGFIVLLFPSFSNAQDFSDEINVFAAASLTDVMSDISASFERIYNIKVFLNLASSNALRLQIEKGADCHVFISADSLNTNLLQKKDLVLKEKVLLSNSLVVITSLEDHIPLKNFSDMIHQDIDFIALSDPETVPSGIYAKQALISSGIWPEVQDLLAPAVNVRAALAYVQKGHARYGIVYKTDAMNLDKTKIIYDIPQRYHKPIEYVVCAIKQRSRENDEHAYLFYSFLESAIANDLFLHYGFISRR